MREVLHREGGGQESGLLQREEQGRAWLRNEDRGVKEGEVGIGG